jgi:hypothetical protein
MLETRQITQAEFGEMAGKLRVLGPDNAWWQIRAADGIWFRWDGQSWIQATPPESSFDRPTELAFEVKSPPAANQHADQHAANLAQPSQPRQPATPRQNTLRIFRGQPALELLLAEKLIREIFTSEGKRYQILNLQPSGSIRGIAYRVSRDGYLDPDAAVEAFVQDRQASPGGDDKPC